MEIIRSADNKTVKYINKLKLKKYRDEYGEFFVEGYKNVLDTCSARPELVRLVVFSESAYGEFGNDFKDCECIVVADNIYGKLTETNNAQGIMCVCSIPKSEFPSSECCILLDRVRDPGNVGTILRTAVACGYGVIANNCADIYSPKVTRSAMSAVVKCKIGIDILPEDIKAAGYELIVADMHGENVFESSHEKKYCVVVGNEAEGVSEDVKAIADRLLSIPQENMESLNAAVAAGIMMFALRYA